MRRSLLKKLLRDLWHLRGQVLATALVVACGVASFVSMQSTYDSLLATQQDYYTEYRFADIFAHLTRAPESLKSSIERIPGVAVVNTRILTDGLLDLPNLREPAQGRIVSIPERRTPILNDLYLVRGRYITAGRPDEVMISGSFADANGFDPGDTIAAVINGRWRRFTIVGVAMTPEYIYEIRPGDIFPDNRRFGILWMGREEVAAAMNMEGAFNDLTVSLAPGANAADVIDAIDKQLEPYGGTGAYGRDDQQSHRFIANEYSELETFGTFLPLIFLAVTAFILHLVLSRLVRTQREQIGLLKAFGYGNSEIGIHFLGLAFASVTSGLIAGILLGAWLGDGMTRMYGDYFRFPVLTVSLEWQLIVWSIVITLGAACVGAFLAVREAVNLPPAEAMRPEAPADYSPGILERMGIRRFLSTEYRIVLRNLSRHPGKALASVVAIALASSLLFTGFYFTDAIKKIVEIQFDQAIREDAIITFNTARPQKARLQLGGLPGVSAVETFRAVPARLSHGYRTKRSALMGVESSADLHRIIDRDSRLITVPTEGVVLSGALADLLAVRPGDRMTVEVLEGKRPKKELVVASTINDLMGMNAYMDIRALNRLMNEDDIISGAYLDVDETQAAELYSLLKRMPVVAGVGLPGAIRRSFDETFAETIGIFTSVLVLFSSAIVFGVVYNAARISLSERGRELASLRVLGFTQREIANILMGEHAVLTVAAIPVGFLFGMFVCKAMNLVIDTEIIRLPLVYSPRTFILTAFWVVVAAAFSAGLVSWRLRKLDLIAVLKTRE